MRVLVIKPSSFGDVIHALPMVHALRQHPGVEALDWVINTEYQSLLEGNHDVTRMIVFPRRQKRHLVKFLGELRREYYDWVIDLQGLLRSGLMTALARGRCKIGMSDSREGASLFYSQTIPVSTGHAIERYQQVLQGLGVQCNTLTFSLPPPDEFKEAPDSFILIHPYSRWPTKQLPKKLVFDLVKQLAPTPVLIVGQGKPWNVPGAIDFTNRTSFKELIGLIKKAEVIISTDSGPMHLASALEKPLVALFGPTDPLKTGPWTKNSRVMQLGLPCIPCLSRKCRIAETQACLQRITVADVLNALKQVLH